MFITSNWWGHEIFDGMRHWTQWLSCISDWWRGACLHVICCNLSGVLARVSISDTAAVQWCVKAPVFPIWVFFLQFTRPSVCTRRRRVLSLFCEEFLKLLQLLGIQATDPRHKLIDRAYCSPVTNKDVHLPLVPVGRRPCLSDSGTRWHLRWSPQWPPSWRCFVQTGEWACCIQIGDLAITHLSSNVYLKCDLTFALWFLSIYKGVPGLPRTIQWKPRWSVQLFIHACSPSSSFQEPLDLVEPQSISAHAVSSASCENMLGSVWKDIAIFLYATCAVASPFFSAVLPRFSGHCEAQCDSPQKTHFRSSLPLMRSGCDCCWGKKPRAIRTWCCFALASRSGQWCQGLNFFFWAVANTSWSSPLLSGISISPVIWSSSSLTAPPPEYCCWPASEIAYLTGCVPRAQYQYNFSKRNWDQKVVLTPPLLFLPPHEPVLRIIITLHQALHHSKSSLQRCHVKMVMKNNKHTRPSLPNILCQRVCDGATVARSACDWR